MNKTQKIVLIALASLVTVSPLLAFAQVTEGSPGQKYTNISGIINAILKPIYLIAVGLAIIFAMIAGIIFITASGDPEKIGKARQALIWAVAGLAVAIVAFSLQAVVTNYV